MNRSRLLAGEGLMTREIPESDLFEAFMVNVGAGVPEFKQGEPITTWKELRQRAGGLQQQLEDNSDRYTYQMVCAAGNIAEAMEGRDLAGAIGYFGDFYLNYYQRELELTRAGRNR